MVSVPGCPPTPESRLSKEGGLKAEQDWLFNLPPYVTQKQKIKFKV